MDAAVGAVGAGALLLGLALASIGLYGMLRKPGIFDQLHAAGLVTGSGVILVLLASLASASAEIATSAGLVVAFVLITSSLSVHAIALAAWRLGPAWTPAGAADDAAEPGTGASAGASAGPLRVVVAHDGSTGADVAISLVASLPWPDGSMIRVIGCTEGDLQPLTTASAPGPTGPAHGDLAAALEAAVSSLQRPGVAVEGAVRHGDPATAIASEAAALGADLVVVGSRGLGPARTLVLGSVAAAVVDAAPCSVLVARAPSVETAVLATDGSGPSDAAAEVVARWAVFEGIRVAVLAVATGVPQYGDLPVSGGMREAREIARQRTVADTTAMRLHDAGRDAVPHVLTGDAAARIVGFSAARSIDLIVIGSRGRTGLKRALLGSVGRAVLSSARGSVLIVRALPVAAESRTTPR